MGGGRERRLMQRPSGLKGLPPQAEAEAEVLLGQPVSASPADRSAGWSWRWQCPTEQQVERRMEHLASQAGCGWQPS